MLIWERVTYNMLGVPVSKGQAGVKTRLLDSVPVYTPSFVL